MTSLMIYLFKDYIASCFTQDENVVKIVTSIIWLISFNTFPDGYKGMLKGMIKALELQKLCAFVNFISHWCINITLMWYFGIHLGYEIKGLWYAKLIMEYCVWTFYSLLIYFTDWEKRAKLSRDHHS